MSKPKCQINVKCQSSNAKSIEKQCQMPKHIIHNNVKFQSSNFKTMPNVKIQMSNQCQMSKPKCQTNWKAMQNFKTHNSQQFQSSNFKTMPNVKTQISNRYQMPKPKCRINLIEMSNLKAQMTKNRQITKQQYQNLLPFWPQNWGKNQDELMNFLAQLLAYLRFIRIGPCYHSEPMFRFFRFLFT